MLIITKAEVINVDNNYGDMYYQLAELKHNREPFVLGEDLVHAEAMIELIKGHRYVDHQRGIDVVIGCSKEAKEALLMQYRLWKINEEEAFVTITKKCEELEHVYKKLGDAKENVSNISEDMHKIENAPFFTRLKWLFAGVKV